MSSAAAKALARAQPQAVDPLALLDDPFERRSLALADRPFFAALYLGLATPPHFQRWCDFFDEPRGLLLGPRSHGKTYVAGRVVPDHDIIRDRWVKGADGQTLTSRILIISRKFDGAKKSLLAVKTDLETNIRMRDDFSRGRPWHPRLAEEEVGEESSWWQDKAFANVLHGAFGGKQAAKRKSARLPWTQRAIYIDRDIVMKDPTVEVCGVFGSITGGRFSRIIIDDPEDDESVRNKAQRDRLEEWIRNSVFQLKEPDTKITVIMTRKHSDDLAARLMDDAAFVTIHDKAVQYWPGGIPAFERGPDGREMPVEPDSSKWEVVYATDGQGALQLDDIGKPKIDHIHCEPGGKTLWPEMWPIEAEIADRLSNGSIRHTRERQNFVIDDGSSEFRKTWLDKAKERGAALGFIAGEFTPDGEPDPWLAQLPIDVVVQFWDLALQPDKAKAEAGDTDYCVGLTWGFDLRTWDRYLLRGYRDRGLSRREKIMRMKREAARFPSRQWVIMERNSFAILHETELAEETDLPIVGHTTKGSDKADPVDGIPRLATLLENGKVVLPYGTDEARAFVDVMVAELHGFGTEAHDDTVLAWWVGEFVLGNPKIRKWLETKVRKGLIRRPAGALPRPTENGEPALAEKKKPRVRLASRRR